MPRPIQRNPKCVDVGSSLQEIPVIALRNIPRDASADLGALTIAVLVGNTKLVGHGRYRAPPEALLHDDGMLVEGSALSPVAQVSLATSLCRLPHQLMNSSERYVIRNLTGDSRFATKEKSAYEQILAERPGVVQMPK